VLFQTHVVVLVAVRVHALHTASEQVLLAPADLDGLAGDEAGALVVLGLKFFRKLEQLLGSFVTKNQHTLALDVLRDLVLVVQDLVGGAGAQLELHQPVSREENAGRASEGFSHLLQVLIPFIAHVEEEYVLVPIDDVSCRPPFFKNFIFL